LTQIEETDLKNYFEIKRFIDQKSLKEKKVKFLSETSEQLLNLNKFINCFEYNPGSITDSHVDYSKKKFFDLNKNITYKEKKQLGSFLFDGLLKSDYECKDKILKEFLQSIPLKKIQLLDLLVYAWLSKLYENIPCLYKMLLVFSGFSMYSESSTPTSEPDEFNFQNEDTDETNFEECFAADYLNEFKTITENSTSLIQCLMIAWIFRSLLIKVSYFQWIFFYKLLMYNKYYIGSNRSISNRYSFSIK